MSLGTRECSRIAARVLFGALVAGAAACTRERLVQGQCKPYNGADVCAWHTMSGDRVVAFGATIPVKVVENAPADMPMAWPPKADLSIQFDSMVTAATGFDNFNIFWEPHGHPPGPYLTPHFDVHFNSASVADVAKIDCADSTKPSVLPAGYELPDAVIPGVGTLIGICVPGMGMHSLPGAELRSTALFEKTMLVGYYHRAPIFIEPMVARATLLAKRSFSLPVPSVAGEPDRVKLPSAFEAVYDSAAAAYRFTFRMVAGS